MLEISIPWISVIIPTYGPGGVSLTSRCLASLAATHSEIEHIQIVVVDDGSGEAVASELQALCDAHRAELVVRRVSGGFAAACNDGLRRSNGYVSILLNNDVYFEHCPALQIVADTVDVMNAGAVGCRLLYPDRRIQHGGVVFVPTPGEATPGYFDHFMRNKSEWHPLAVTIRPSLVTGALFAISRGAIGMIGLLDERYGMAVEDIDYQLECMTAGVVPIYNGYAWAIHEEGRTRGATPEEKERLAPEKLALERLALTLFFQKWSTTNWGRFVPKGLT